MSKAEIQALTTQLATHEIFGQIRFIQTEEGEIYFVAVDICKILGIRNPTQAVARLDEDERAMFNIGRSPIHGGGGETNFVNEPGLYRLIFKSRKPAAKDFQRWVYHEVLPSIRKYGYYSLEDERSDWTGDQWMEYYEDLKKKIPFLTEEEKLALADDPDILVWSVNGGKYNVKVCV